jgi:coiled-coil domain-containing protein 39
MNADVEKNISAGERQVAKHREDQALATSSLQQYRNEIEVLKNTLNKSATDLLNRKSELNNGKSDLVGKQSKLEKNRAHFEELKKKMYAIDSETLTLEQKSEQVFEF